MNITQLKQVVDDIYSMCDEDEKDNTVVITLSEPSVGGRACVGISGVHSGFDWEHRQIRVEPSEPIVRMGNAKTDEKEKVVLRYGKMYGSRNCLVYLCPCCRSKISKGDKFCRYCGQLMGEPSKTINDMDM